MRQRRQYRRGIRVGVVLTDSNLNSSAPYGGGSYGSRGPARQRCSYIGRAICSVRVWRNVVQPTLGDAHSPVEGFPRTLDQEATMSSDAAIVL